MPRVRPLVHPGRPRLACGQPAVVEPVDIGQSGGAQLVFGADLGGDQQPALRTQDAGKFFRRYGAGHLPVDTQQVDQILRVRQPATGSQPVDTGQPVHVALLKHGPSRSDGIGVAVQDVGQETSGFGQRHSGGGIVALHDDTQPTRYSQILSRPGILREPRDGKLGGDQPTSNQEEHPSFTATNNGATQRHLDSSPGREWRTLEQTAWRDERRTAVSIPRAICYTGKPFVNR
jgi:hypothetical protein